MTKEINETKPTVSRRMEVERPHLSDVERMFENWFQDFWPRPFPRLWRSDYLRLKPINLEAPALDVYEQKDDLIVKAEIPGLSKDEIDISLEGNILTIRGEKKKEEEVKEENYYRCERAFGSFLRTFELPMDVQPEKVNATFKDGVLEIRMPKSEEAKKNVVKVKVA